MNSRGQLSLHQQQRWSLQGQRRRYRRSAAARRLSSPSAVLDVVVYDIEQPRRCRRLRYSCCQCRRRSSRRRRCRCTLDRSAAAALSVCADQHRSQLSSSVMVSISMKDAPPLFQCRSGRHWAMQVHEVQTLEGSQLSSLTHTATIILPLLIH